jgi:poly-gamma-glutamate capsule biosynthesis protein CapA/YwtB (metallophosphatase superfamily)
MAQTVILTGDINLLGLKDTKVPFAQVGPTLRAAELVVSNFECCLYKPDLERSVHDEGFYASLASGEALIDGGIGIIGNANNVNFGAPAIRSSCARLDELGIPHAGAGVDRESAYAPVFVEKDGVKYGFMQRTSVYWSHGGHEAAEDHPGVAIVHAHTAYKPLVTETKTLTRPGNPPEIVTWCEPSSLKAYQDELAAARKQCDVLIASNHWGCGHDVLQYMEEIGRAAIDAGADVVMGHGPHFPLSVEVYKGKAIFYSLGSFSFHTGHRAQKHPDWIGFMPKLTVDGNAVTDARIALVRHNEKNETYFVSPAKETAELNKVYGPSEKYGTKFSIDGDDVVVGL